MALFAFRDPQSLDSFVPVLCRGSMLRGNTITRTGSPKICLSCFTMTSAVLFINARTRICIFSFNNEYFTFYIPGISKLENPVSWPTPTTSS